MKELLKDILEHLVLQYLDILFFVVYSFSHLLQIFKYVVLIDLVAFFTLVAIDPIVCAFMYILYRYTGRSVKVLARIELE